MGLRRVGIIYDRIKIEVPAAFASQAPDFWAVDAAALPFNSHAIATVTAINLVDCAASPSGIISEFGRYGHGRRRGSCHATRLVCTGHRRHTVDGRTFAARPTGRCAGTVLSATLESVGIKTVAEAEDLIWRLRLHARSVMEYSVHGVAGHKFEETPCRGPFS